jgi:hypothetical protein
MIEKRQDGLVDAGVLHSSDDPYLAWLAAAIASKHALHAWLDGPPRDEGALYVAYRAALDREEAAASVLEHVSGARGSRGVRLVNPFRRHRYAAPITHELPQPGVGAE